MSAAPPGPGYGEQAYVDCLYGRADARQQMSLASQVILLNAAKAELLAALTGLADQADRNGCVRFKAPSGAEAEWDRAIEQARAAIAKVRAPPEDHGAAVLNPQGSDSAHSTDGKPS